MCCGLVRVDLSNVYGFGKFFCKGCCVYILASGIKGFYRVFYLGMDYVFRGVVGENSYDDVEGGFFFVE